MGRAKPRNANRSNRSGGAVRNAPIIESKEGRLDLLAIGLCQRVISGIEKNIEVPEGEIWNRMSNIVEGRIRELVPDRKIELDPKVVELLKRAKVKIKDG